MSQDPYRYFRVEARELVEQLGRDVLELEKGAAAPEVAGRMLRGAHTLKGAARVVKQARIAELAHAMEDAVTRARDAGPVGREQVDEMLAMLDAMASEVAGLGQDAEPARAATTVAEEAIRTVRADVGEMDALLHRVAEASVQLRGLRRATAGAERARQLAELLADQLGRSRAATVPSRVRSLAEDMREEVVRVERQLAAGIEQAEREMRQVVDAAERLRLVPVSALFASLERTVRDAARAAGKRAAFRAAESGERLDGPVIAALQGALVQLVRNAVAHGIETEAERVRAGKPAEGTVRVRVGRRGNRVVFTCEDDGRGIDLEAVRRVAHSRGVSAAEAHRVGADELLALLLRGGLSTSGAVTQLAGRGIGLDVVRSAAAGLGGEVSVRTAAGKGTAVDVVVPASVSSLDALLVDAGGVAAALPLGSVRGVLRVDAVVRSGGGESVVYDGQTIPFVPLAVPLKGKAAASGPRRFQAAVVIAASSAMVAVGVDRLVGSAHVAMRPVPAIAAADAVVAGAALDPEGDPQVVLDPEAVVAAVQAAETWGSSPAPAARLPLLVVDDSLTTRMLEQSILESAGYEVDVASSGEEALEKARRRRYGLMLVDVEMPGMDGFSLVERTRVEPALQGVPAILVTSRSAPEDRRRGEEVGARAYVVKSEFDQEGLLETIRRLVG